MQTVKIGSSAIAPTTPQRAGYRFVRWSDTFTNAQRYYIMYKKNLDLTYKVYTTTAATSYKMANLADGVKYTFKIVPYKTVNGKVYKGTAIIKTVSSKYSSITLNTTKNKTYYYKVRSYVTVSNKKIYAPWSYVKAYKLK